MPKHLTNENIVEDPGASRTALGGGAAGQQIFQAATISVAQNILGLNDEELNWREWPIGFISNITTSGPSIPNSVGTSISTGATSGTRIQYTTIAIPYKGPVGGINFNYDLILKFTARTVTNTANGLARIQLGGDFYRASGFHEDTATNPRLNRSGIAIDVRGGRMWLLAHNNTTLTEVDSNYDLTATNAQILLRKTGTTLELLADNTIIATINGFTAPVANNNTLFYYITNKTDSSIYRLEIMPINYKFINQ
jgi:hypothetical protein